MAATPDRRERILSSSAELFATKGIAATTVRDIGETAGVFSGSLYHYFKSKNAIASEILDRFMADIQQRFDRVDERANNPADSVRGLILETLLVIEEHPYPTAIYQNDRQYLRDNGLLEPIDIASRDVRAHWLVAIRAGTEDGTFRKDLPPEIFYRSVRDTLWATNYWPDRQRYTVTEFADMMTSLFFSGFVAGSTACSDEARRRPTRTKEPQL